MPQWKLESCIQGLCGDSPDLLGAARASNMYFANAEVAEMATRALEEIMGGVMDVSKAPNEKTASTASNRVWKAISTHGLSL